MKKRLITGAIITVIAAGFISSRLLTPYLFDLFIGVLAIMGCVEIARTMERKRMFSNIIFIGSFPAILYISMSIGIINGRDWYYYLFYFIFIIMALFLINFLYTIILKKVTNQEKEKYNVSCSTGKFALQKCMNSTFVMVYPAILFSAFLFMNHYFDFSFVYSEDISNPILLIVFFITFTFVVTMVLDSMALVVGKICKGPKLCPLISPNKTISGSLGGFVFGSLGGLLTYYLFNINNNISGMFTYLDITWWKILIVSMVMSIIGQIGDLTASALKRSARVKDYGTIFPGHGGVMDRVDGLIFNAVVVLVAMFILI